MYTLDAKNYGVDPNIESFMQRRSDYFTKDTIDGTYRQRIDFLKSKQVAISEARPLIVISGAGPAGLLRAIQAIGQGYPVKLIEKRDENGEGRVNTVHLTKASVLVLKYCGIYQYLFEKKLINPPDSKGSICVRLIDLELAMKAVLKELISNLEINFKTQIESIDFERSNMVIVSTDEQKKVISDVGLIVNAEGSKSSTNDLCKISRVEVLPKIPVIAAIYKDKRPKINSAGNFFKYIGRSIAYLARTIHYHVQFLFRFVFSKAFRTQLKGAIILKTPGQSYIGACFSETITNKMVALKKDYDDKQKHLEDNLDANAQKQLTAAVKASEKKYKSFLRKWTNLSLCAGNFISVKFKKTAPFTLYSSTHKSLGRVDLISIGADRAEKYTHNGKVLLAGDACATVDPSTGLGCNFAIQSSTAFLDFLWDREKKSTAELMENYQKSIEKSVEYIHVHSKGTRVIYG